MSILKHTESAVFVIRTGISEPNQMAWHLNACQEVYDALTSAGKDFNVTNAHDDTLVTRIEVTE